MTLVCPQYIEYEITDVSPVFIGEFRTWNVDRTGYSFLPEGKLLKRKTRSNSSRKVGFGTDLPSPTRREATCPSSAMIQFEGVERSGQRLF